MTLGKTHLNLCSYNDGELLAQYVARISVAIRDYKEHQKDPMAFKPRTKRSKFKQVNNKVAEQLADAGQQKKIHDNQPAIEDKPVGIVTPKTHSAIRLGNPPIINRS